MDALRKSLAIMVALVAVICIVPLSDDSEASGRLDGLMLYEVYPYEPEGVSVFNYGSTPVDLKNYIIADQNSITSKSEGYVTFSKSIIVEPGKSVVIAEKVLDDALFTNRGNAYAFGENGITMEGKFNLGNSGDDVYLFDTKGKLIDAMCYGDKTISDSSIWFGDSAPKSNRVIIQRQGSEDTDSADDWFLWFPGRTDEQFDPNRQFDATVTPFLFPDSGGIPIYRALESATQSVCINIFLLGNSNIFALLCDLAENGVEVKLLLEGEPTSIGNVSAQAKYIKALIDAGGEVRLIGVGDSNVRDRYDVDHAKYAIIDMDTVVITSENWTNDNTNGKICKDIYNSKSNGNRGWGAVIESKEYAQYMKNVFDSDYSTEYGDVKDFEDMSIYSNTKAATLTYKPADTADFSSFKAKVTPFVSPDNSFEGTKYYIEKATHRIYSEQQSLAEAYQKPESDSPLTIMREKANNDSTDVRLLISTNVTDSDKVAEYINQSSLVKTGVLQNPYIHNKGLVCDDVSVVSSVNWTSNSFFNNRESAVAIISGEIADYFAEAFERDFDQCYTYGGYRIDTVDIQTSYPAGKEITFQVKVSPETPGLKYVWDLGDGSEPRTTDNPRIACKPISNGAASAYKLTVTVYDSNGDQVGQVTRDYTVISDEMSDDYSPISGISDYIYYIIGAIIVILGALGIKVGTGGKKKSKSTKSKKSSNTKKRK